MFFNWYSDRWWFDELGSCVAQAQNLERVVETSIILDHYPRIEKEREDEPNIGKIVSCHLKSVNLATNILWGS